MPVPDGLAGERVDAALARLFGVSRTKAADLAAAGGVLLDGRAVGKSDRLAAGAVLEVSLPDPDAPTGPVVVASLAIVLVVYLWRVFTWRPDPPVQP